MRRQWIAVAGVVGALALGAFLLVRLSPQVFPVGVGSAAPAFTAVDVATGDTVTLERYRNSVVILNIWATWCEPCRVEMPSLERLHTALGPEGLKVVAVSVDVGSRDDVREFRRYYGLTFQVLQDRTQKIERSYQTSAVPESFVIDRHGVIVKKIVGPYEWDNTTSKALAKRLLAKGG